MVQIFARRVDNRYLAARAIRGVEPEYYLAFERRLQQERFEIALERFNRLLGRAVEQLRAHLALYTRLNEPFVAVLDSRVDERVERRPLLFGGGDDGNALRLVHGDARL